MKELFTKPRLLPLLLILFFSSGVLLAQDCVLKIGSVSTSRNSYYTFDGGSMNPTVEKLQNTANFGSGGTLPYTVEITSETGTITAALLSQYDMFFIGYFYDGTFSSSELQALSDWVNAGGRMLITADDGNFDAVAEHFGYPTTSQTNLPNYPTPGQANHPAFNGPFGTLTEFSGAETLGYFPTTTGATVLAVSAEGRAVLLEKSVGAGLIVISGDINTMDEGSLSSGGGITNNNDKFMANLFHYVGAEFCGVAPQISCPANITVDNQTGQCGAVVAFAATETVGIPASTITYSIPSGSFFPVGTTTVKATATNELGSSECTFTVTVSDTERPAISCPADINATATSANGAVVNYTAPTGTDNCPGAVTTRIEGPASGSTFPIGTTTVTHRVRDAAGNNRRCSFTVTVTGVAPQISCPANVSVSNTPGQCGASVTFAATETTGIPASTITYSPASGSFFSLGTTTVTATATNASGSSECTFTVTVNDTQPPAITCPANINATATSFNGAAVTYTAPTGTDNCPGATTSRIAGPASGSTFPVGTTTVTYEVTDAANNKTQCSFTVTVDLPTCGNKNQNVQICYYGVTQCVSEKIAKNYIKLGATLGPCNAGNTRIGVEETNAPITLSLKAYPNPVQDAVTVEVMAPAAGMATLEVLDVTGLTRQSRQQQLSEGSNEVGLRLGSLPTGIYLIRAIDALGHQAVVRVNKQ